MSYHNLFKQYIWLLNTIHRAKQISFEEINHKWQQTYLSDGVPISRTTFNRHKQAIEEMFDIVIECDRHNGYKYYISNPEVLSDNSIQNWMLSTMSVNHILSESHEVHDRIILEQIPSDGDFLHQVIEAMKFSRLVYLEYQRYGCNECTEMTIEPYCVKLFRRRWYLLARGLESRDFYVLSFDRIKSLEIIADKFDFDTTFNAEEYFSDFFGMVHNKSINLERIIVRAFAFEQYYIKDLPLHHSQKIVAKTNNHTDYELHLRPTPDFISHLLSRGEYLKVLSPQWLADEIKQKHEDSMKIYSKE